MKNEKGFTLIELLAVIVILAVIALIATPIILNMINDAKKNAAKDSAYGYIQAIEYETAISGLKGKNYKDKDDYTYDEIIVNVKGDKPTSGFYALKNGQVVSGVFCINGYTLNYNDNVVRVGEGGCDGDSLKFDGKVELSPTNGTYKYSESKEFEVTTNLSNGELSCSSNNEAIATCKMNGKKVIVTSGKEEGQADITVTSSSTSKFKVAEAVYLVTVAKIDLSLDSYTVKAYDGEYDGKPHGIEITMNIDGATIKYGTSDGTYDKTESPTYKDAGTYTIYYQIEKEGYNVAKGSSIVNITKAEGSVKAPTAKTLTYTGSAQELINAGSSDTGTIEYKLNNGTYSTNIPTATNVGTYTVYYRVVGDKNHNNVTEKSITVTIEKAEPVITETSAECFGFSNGIITSYTVSDKCTTDVVIPSSIGGVEVTGIGSGAFYNRGLTSVIIPNSVTSIAGGSFNTNNLTSVVIPGSVKIIEGASFQNNKLESVTISNGVTEIQGSAFNKNKIKNLVIPGSVKLIRIHAFEENEIENLTLENGIETIESYSFQNNKLTTLTFPSSLTTISQSSFSSNPNLTTIYNKTGKSFNFGAVVGGSSASLETGTITGDNGQVITITK